MPVRQCHSIGELFTTKSCPLDVDEIVLVRVLFSQRNDTSLAEVIKDLTLIG